MYGGMAKTVFGFVLENKLKLYVSEDLKFEVLRKLREYGADQETTEYAELFLNHRSVSISSLIKVTVCRDPSDNFLLELAQSAKANYLITRDKDLLELPNSEWKTTKIVKPEEFLRLVRNSKLFN